MARLVTFISNRPDVGARAIDLEKRHLLTRVPMSAHGTGVGWGVGFYQAGEILLKRRPIDDRSEVSLAELARDTRADILIAHVRLGTIGAPRTENTHPFRYRQWLFAQTGTVEAFSEARGRMIESLPTFLARDVRGETDSELVFHLFLSFLHDVGKLDRPSVDAQSARAALASCVALVDRLSAEQGAGPNALNIVVSCADYVLAMHGRAKMAYRVFSGKAEMDRLLTTSGLTRTRTPEEAIGRLTVLASDFDDDQAPPGWTSVPERAIVTLTRTDDPQVENF